MDVPAELTRATTASEGLCQRWSIRFPVSAMFDTLAVWSSRSLRPAPGLISPSHGNPVCASRRCPPELGLELDPDPDPIGDTPVQ